VTIGNRPNFDKPDGRSFEYGDMIACRQGHEWLLELSMPAQGEGIVDEAP
jgi:hypothetical protein